MSCYMWIIDRMSPLLLAYINEYLALHNIQTRPIYNLSRLFFIALCS